MQLSLFTKSPFSDYFRKPKTLQVQVSNHLSFVCELGFRGEGKGRKGLSRAKPLFGSFIKIGKGFGGF